MRRTQYYALDGDNPLIYLDRINSLVFKLFLGSIFFIYYDVNFLPGTLHAWLLMIGLVLILPRTIFEQLSPLVHRRVVQFDYLIMLFLLLVFLLGFLVNLSAARFINFQSYVLMLVTFLYAKESVRENTLQFLLNLIRFYLIINSILVFLQIVTGDYFVAESFRNQIAARPPEIATGVHDGSAQNGMITSFAMSFLYARMLISKFRLTLLDCLAFALGFLSLIFAASRAGLVSFAALSVIGLFFVLLRFISDRSFHPRWVFILGYLLLVSSAVYFIVLNSLIFELLWELRSQDAGNYGFGVAQYKITTFSDGSTLQRFDIVSTILNLIAESPLSMTSVGFGTGAYDTNFGINVHNSWLELLVVSGVYGFLAFLVFLSFVFTRALRSAQSVELAPLGFAIASVLIFMLAHDVLRGRLIWMALGLLAGLPLNHSLKPAIALNFRRGAYA